MTETEIAWIAGLLEGEGSFLVKTGTQGYPVIQCSMTDKDIMIRLQSLCGGSLSSHKPKNLNWKETHVWRLGGVAALDIMSKILPHMGERRTNKILEVMSTSEEHTRAKENTKKNRELKHKEAGTAYNNGEGSLREIARRFNVSQVTVLNWSRKLDQ
jgi:hypothetical protein